MGDLTVKQKLTLLIQKGISFEKSQDKLLVKGDLNILSEDDKMFLKEKKEIILSLIEHQEQNSSIIKKMKSEIPKPLSFSQQSLWLLDKINDGSSHYNQTAAFSLKGRIDIEALNKTFLTILKRHESLRSCFFTSDSGTPIQKIQTIEHFNIDFEQLKPSSSNEFVVQEIEKEVQRRFDLTKDLLLNVRLLKLKPEEHLLIVTMHHIASDGWSMGILINEFNTLYANYVNGEDNSLPELNIQFSDYAYWQRQLLRGKVLDKLSNYWVKQLDGLPVVHNLPLDRPRPIIQRFKGDSHDSFVDKKVLTRLYNLCQLEGASLFMGIHAALSCLLARYSNEKDIVIGSPNANREQAEVANLVGFFMNLLVLRSDLSKNPSFSELIKQSKKTLEEAYEHQQMPFGKLVEKLDIKRSISHNPLFQVLLSLHNNVNGVVALPNLVLTPVDYVGKSAKYDLSLNVTEDSSGLNLSWEYNTDIFDCATIKSMAKHFNILLISLVDNPEENIFKVNIIDRAEAVRINQDLRGEEIEVRDKNSVYSSFENQLKVNAGHEAVICNDVSYSYKSLGERVETIANALSIQGVQPGDKIGICLLRSMDLVATIFACFKIGASYIPLDPIYPAERINQIVVDAEPKYIVSLKPLKKRYLDQLPDDRFTFIDQIENQEKYKNPTTHSSDKDIAYIIFTSGTTGKPKGIEITHGNLNNLLAGFDVSYGSKEKQRWLAQTSMNFDISVLELIWTISRGQTIILQQSSPFKLVSPKRLSKVNTIDFSIMFFGADKSKDQKYDLLLETAKFADKNNFSAIWTPERHFGEFGGAFPNPSVISSALSVITNNICIRSGSVVLPLHDPIRVAEEWSLVDNLSNGRIGVSIASGWQPDDFVMSNADYTNRHQIMRDKISELKELWKGNPVIRTNGIGKDCEIKIRPQPIQKDLPIWITAGGSPETFKYAGTIGANLLTHTLGQSIEALAGNIAIYHKALIENGFEIKDKKVTLMLHTYIDSSEKTALGISEKPFKDYLGSSIKLMEPLAKEFGIDVNDTSQRELLIDLSYNKFSKENTLMGSPESCQKMLFNIQEIGVTEVACLVDFGVEKEKVLAGLERIVETKKIYDSFGDFISLLNIDNQKTELDLIDNYKVTHVQMTPSQSKLVLDLYNQTEGKDLSSVKHWFIGGEALNENLINGLNTITSSRLYNMYGPTETTVWSAWREIKKDDIHIGNPVINTELLLLNEFEQLVPIGVVGELYIGGLGVGKGYYNNRKLTEERFREINIPNYKSKRFYKTGDLMKLNASGTFEYIGRKDNQVKVNGYRIELEEIEKTITNISGIKNCKVVPVAGHNSNTLSAYVVKEEIVLGAYKELPEEMQAKPFHLADGSLIYHQSDRQLGMLYKEIMEDGIYYKHDVFVPENGLVLDLGANVGGFSIDVSQRQPSTTVIAVEPIPQIFSALKKNFEYRQIKGRILNFGVSNKKESATFYYYPEMAGMSGRFADKETIVDAVENYISHDKKLLQHDANHRVGKEREAVASFYENMEGSDEVKQYLTSLYKAEEVECQLTTVSDIIDELNIQKIDLLKLDVEKSECLVLEGIRPEHWSMIRHLAIEVDGDHNLEIILKLLKEKEYTVNVDNLVLSDSTLPNEDNTYMLYATNPRHGILQNEGAIKHIHVPVNESAIRNLAKQKLPDYMIPKDINFVPSIPLMANGKVDLVKLKNINPKKLTSKNLPKLTNKTELKIYGIWCEVLKKENIPHHISIFEAGGNSIEIVLLHEKLQTAFSTNFSLVELFRNPTIPQQAKLVKDAHPKSISRDTSQNALDKGKARRKARARKAK